MKLEISNLSLYFEERKVLKNLNFEVLSGEWLAVIGPNGAGKSSLLKSILQINNHYEGKITFAGDDISQLDGKKRAEYFSYVPQMNLDLDSHFCVSDLMWMSRYPYAGLFGQLSQQEQQRAKELLEELDISEYENSPITELSGGQRQRAMLAASLFQDSQLILMDEPTSFLDPAHQEDMIQLFRNIKKTKKSAMLITHDINLAFTLCDKVLALKNGELVYFGSSIMQKSVLEQVFDKKFESISHKGRDLILPVNYYI